MSERYRLRLGDLRCTVATRHERYATMLASVYGTRAIRETDPSGPVDLQVHIGEGRPSARIPPADRLIVSPAGDAFWLETDPLTCVLRAGSAAREASVTVHDPGLPTDLLAYHLWIVFNRAMLLLDRVILHAAGVSYRGSVSLFVGPKGAGKSTIAIALAEVGAEVLAEDHLLARRMDGRTWVSGCNGRMRVTAQTERHFLAGKLGPETIDATGVPKKEFPADRFFRARPHEERPADRLFFPHVGTRFLVGPVARRVALLRLVDVTGSMLRFHDRRDYADFLSRLAALLDSLPCYDLELSPRLGDLAGLVELLERQA